MITTHQLPVPGATIFYKVQGSGPVLLVLQGGNTDADGSDGLAAHLLQRFTVVSLDRRGLSRSTLAAPVDRLTIATHAEDAHRVLAAVTSEPAWVLGVSIGAVIGLELATRHPEQVRAVVVHEPPLNALLTEAELAPFVRAQLELEAEYQSRGPMAAMSRFVGMLGIQFDDREPDAPMASRGPFLLPNLEFFITRDAPAVRLYAPDLAALKATGVRVIPAVGSSSRAPGPGQLDHARPVRALGERLGVPVVEFPGSHGGYATRPRAFAARLCEVLDAPAA